MKKEKTEIDSRAMGEMNMNRLFLTMSVPLIISMIVQALYNVVDSMFVARLSEDALTAVSLVSPVQNLMIAVATGTGVGYNALISRRLGQKHQEEADLTAGNGLLAELVSFGVFLVIGLCFSGPFIQTQINSPGINPTHATVVAGYAVDYMRIVLGVSIGLFVQITMERFLQATGRTVYNMVTQVTGAVINIVLDPLLIFGIGPFPRMEVAGAALATVIAQCVAGILAYYFNRKYNPEIRLKLQNLRPRSSVIRQIYLIGFPSMLMVSLSSIMLFGMNKILLKFSLTAVAVFGVYFKIQSVVFMPLFGMNNALVPIIGYNFGAGNKKRILSAHRTGLLYGCIFMWVGLALFQLFPGQIMGLFDASGEMLTQGILELRINSLVFACAGVSVISGSFYQATGKSMYSLIVSFIRQIVVLLPLAYLMSLTGSLTLVWWSVTIAEGVGFTVTLLLRRRLVRSLDQMLARVS